MTAENASRGSRLGLGFQAQQIRPLSIVVLRMMANQFVGMIRIQLPQRRRNEPRLVGLVGQYGVFRLKCPMLDQLLRKLIDASWIIGGLISGFVQIVRQVKEMNFVGIIPELFEVIQLRAVDY